MRKILLISIAFALLLPTAAGAIDSTPAVSTWDNTITITTPLSVPFKRVSYTVESKKVVLVVGVQDILKELWKHSGSKYSYRELDAKIQRRSKIFNNVDITHIAEAPVNDRLMLDLLRPLIEAGKVSVYQTDTLQYAPSIGEHDHGSKQGTTILGGSVDYALLNGSIFASYSYIEQLNPTSISY